ncbi:hypothetical protein PBAL39_14039 [Pedobacter sp. BAL39]|uniref:diacylglycerol/lipid kinase family protein n=1 Tax=Pedobacter sp. BAL39 TaxID=391596 RepID=UPI000155AB28|nr:diacylglycerol kinase family protein [Pedobacter sp. BAL39]EDM34683.1 hypothetical protein PBAL39_14039 [Pedobacter sp. BAL39]
MKKGGKLIRLVHNPTAGEGRYTKKEIISLIESHGFRCAYTSSKRRGIRGVDPETEFIAIAGGDGTVRKIILKLLDKKLKYKRPIALLPFGTANNIATALHISSNNKSNITSWNNYHLKKFDVGQVVGLETIEFFIESFGTGLFPKLMSTLKATDTTAIDTPEKEFKLALDTLHELSMNYEATAATIEIDDQVFEDRFLLIEVMNISSVGPHLKLSPDADPGDGYFDVVLVRESERALLSSYFEKRKTHERIKFPVKTIRTKSLIINTSCQDLHSDDQVLENTSTGQMHIKNLDSLLEFVVNKKSEV